jgi:hypothetical protein
MGRSLACCGGAQVRRRISIQVRISHIKRYAL